MPPFAPPPLPVKLSSYPQPHLDPVQEGRPTWRLRHVMISQPGIGCARGTVSPSAMHPWTTLVNRPAASCIILRPHASDICHSPNDREHRAVWIHDRTRTAVASGCLSWRHRGVVPCSSWTSAGDQTSDGLLSSPSSRPPRGLLPRANAELTHRQIHCRWSICRQQNLVIICKDPYKISSGSACWTASKPRASQRRSHPTDNTPWPLGPLHLFWTVPHEATVRWTERSGPVHSPLRKQRQFQISDVPSWS